METLKFLSPDQVRAAVAVAGTPVFVYAEAALERAAHQALAFPAPFGLTVRYAMKACPNGAILRLFARLGLHIDASSGFEVSRALAAGVAAERISLSTQELPADFADLVRAGIKVNACSLSQLDRYGRAFPGGRVGVRFNPGLGSGGTHKTNVGGPASSFGIWHEQVDQVETLVSRHGLTVERIHTHIGSGSDPAVWLRVSEMSLTFVRRFPNVTTLNLGGGYKVARMSGEKATDLQAIGAPVGEALERFASETGRELHLEIEPGTYLVANAGALVTTVQDAVETGAEGYRFLKLDAGMTEVCRPSLYGARHPMTIVPAEGDGMDRRVVEYVVVGHCCESGDMLTPAAGEPETLEPRPLREARIGDLLVIDGAGAYCSAMSTKNYNSFPEAPEVLIRAEGHPVLIRRRQALEQITQNEVRE
jgi:diaminopimelate decarboxylase